ncbi:MAG: DUF2570 domain-containing protein [Leclercia sp.]
MTALITAFELFKAHWRWWLTITALVLFAWLWHENTRINASLGALQEANDSNRAVMDNVLKMVAITNIVLGANQHAKNQLALQSQGAQEYIKMAVANDDCAHQPVPPAAADRLRQFAESLRIGSGNAASGKPDS